MCYDTSDSKYNTGHSSHGPRKGVIPLKIAAVHISPPFYTEVCISYGHWPSPNMDVHILLLPGNLSDASTASQEHGGKSRKMEKNCGSCPLSNDGETGVVLESIGLGIQEQDTTTSIQMM